jgi:ABC-2 type transport system permease protein
MSTVTQLLALFRMELRLLWRNRAAAVLVVVLPLAIAPLRLGGYDVESVGSLAAATKLASILGILPVIFLHHHLVTVYATRRQELVLKRLRAGLASGGTILTGAASASLALSLAQAVVIMGYATIVLGFPAPVNPVTVLLALLLFSALMTTVSAVMSAVTTSSEAAMVTTAPTMALFLATPGMLVPFGAFPEELERAAWFSPAGPFAELVRDGWLGGGVFDAVPGLAVMAGWLVLTMLLVSRYFRWEPRRA